MFQILGPPPGKAPAAGPKDGNLSLSPRHLVAPLCLQDTADAALARGSRVTTVWCGLPASRVTVAEAADIGSPRGHGGGPRIFGLQPPSAPLLPSTLCLCFSLSLPSSLSFPISLSFSLSLCVSPSLSVSVSLSITRDRTHLWQRLALGPHRGRRLPGSTITSVHTTKVASSSVTRARFASLQGSPLLWPQRPGAE